MALQAEPVESIIQQHQKENQMKLHKKILEIMKEVEYVQKDMNIMNYKALSEEKVIQTIRPHLLKHGLIILPVECHHRVSDFKTNLGKIAHISTMDIKYKIIDVDTDEFEIVVGSGCGVDSQDKAPGSAATYAGKYMLLKTFLIPTGLDPDKVGSTDKDKDIGTKDQPDNIPTALQLELKTLMSKAKKTGKLTVEQLGEMLGKCGAAKITDLDDTQSQTLINEIKGEK